MSQFNAHFRNINGDDTYPLTDVIYRSKVDGSLLEVEHDRAAQPQPGRMEEALCRTPHEL